MSPISGQRIWSEDVREKIRNPPILFEKLDPSTGRVIALVPEATLEDINRTASRARTGLLSWNQISIEDRSHMISRFANQLVENASSLTSLLTAEQGKPLRDARDEVESSIAVLERAASFVGSYHNSKIISETNSHRIEVRYNPVGVVAAILPWNYPLFLAADKIARSLAFGNVVIIKPSPYTPLTSLRLGELANDVFPQGVVQILTGSDSIVDLRNHLIDYVNEHEINVGEQLVRHPLVDKINFVGSTKTGKRIMSLSSETVKRLTLEMGGNDAAIVLDDVDIEATAEQVLQAALTNNGQICVAIKRVYVQHSIFDRFVNAIVLLANQRAEEVGDGRSKGVTLGPMNNKMQFEKVIDLIEEAKSRGGIIRCGGRVMYELKNPKSGHCWFIAPTIITDMSEDARIVQEEQFGPVLPLIPFTTIEEAISKANSTAFGLGATIW